MRVRVQGSGFRVQGSGFRVQGSGFRVQGSGFSDSVQGVSRSWAPAHASPCEKSSRQSPFAVGTDRGVWDHRLWDSERP